MRRARRPYRAISRGPSLTVEVDNDLPLGGILRIEGGLLDTLGLPDVGKNLELVGDGVRLVPGERLVGGELLGRGEGSSELRVGLDGLASDNNGGLRLVGLRGDGGDGELLDEDLDDERPCHWLRRKSADPLEAGSRGWPSLLCTRQLKAAGAPAGLGNRRMRSPGMPSPVCAPFGMEAGVDAPPTKRTGEWTVATGETATK